jgi:hypothetical protein
MHTKGRRRRWRHLKRSVPSQRSQQCLTVAKQRFGKIRTTGQTASALYVPFMKSLQDQVTFLGHDLNTGSPRSPAVRAAGLDLQPRHRDAEALPGRDVTPEGRHEVRSSDVGVMSRG